MPNIPQVTDHLAWDGVVNGKTALAIAIALALLAGWSLWRERHTLGNVWACAFWVLRLVAFGVALWMLAGPTQTRVERTTTRQSIAIFADDSESMDVVDPSGQADSVRWALATAETPSTAAASAVIACDRLGVTLAAGLADCSKLTTALGEHRSPQQLNDRVSAIAAAIERATNHTSDLTAALDGLDPSFVERASRLSTIIAGSTRDSLTAIQSALAKSDPSFNDDIPNRVEQVSEGLTSARRRAFALGNDLAQVSAVAPPASATIDRLTRREKAGKSLDFFESELDESLAETVDIRRYRFDSVTSPIDAKSLWSNALERLPTADSSTETPPNSDSDARESEAESSTASKSSTNLSAVLQLLAGERLTEATRLAIVLTDGRHNDVDALPPQDVAAQLSSMPIYVVPIGNTQQVRDLMLYRAEAPSVVAEKDAAVIDVIIAAYDCEDQATNVVLRRDGREIDRKSLDLAGNRSDYRVHFKVPVSDLGWQEYIVEVEPIADENNTANNYMPVSFEVVRDQIRVLLADGVARWEYRYLNQLFRRDEHIKFDELLFYPRVHGSGKLEDHPELPKSVEDWANYDVVILGDIGPQQLSTECQQSLDEYVRTRGGNVIVVAGHDAMPAAFANQPLMDLLPVESGIVADPQRGYSLQLTDEGGLQSALLIADAAPESTKVWEETYHRFPVFGLSEYSRPKATARTLIKADALSPGSVRSDDSDRAVEQAFLSWQRVGAGRVAYLAAPETYRLRWRRGDRLHHRFWGQFLRWITAANSGAGTDLVRLQTDRLNYIHGQPVEVTVWLKNTSGRPLAGEAIRVEARTFKDEAISADLSPDPDIAGRYFGALTDLPSGAYQLSVQGRVIAELIPARNEQTEVHTTIAIRTNENPEMANTQCNRALLEQVAQMTGGQVIPPTALSEVLQLVSFTPEVSERVERTPLWNRWSNLCIVLGCLFTEWIVRKAKGLV